MFRSSLPRAAVLDTSCLIKWFAPANENHLAQANVLLDAYVDERIRIVVLDLTYYEVANALSTGKRLDQQQTRAALKLLWQLNLPTVQLDGSLADSATTISDESGLTFYDAAYVTAAHALAIPLITEDKQIVRAHPTRCLPIASVPV